MTKTPPQRAPTSGKPLAKRGTRSPNAGVAQNSPQLALSRDLTYGDQKGQVDFLINHVFDYERHGLPRGGYFVDLACADGMRINNTYFLEKWLGWTGLLFEPNPRFWPSIKANRLSVPITKAVSNRAGQTLPFRIDNGMLGGIVSDSTDNNPQIRGEELTQAEIIEVTTTTLTDELVRADAPPVIDFLSLDIEGSELSALQGFDFERYKIRCTAIERPTPALDILLDGQGYRQVRHTAFDVIYVHRDYLSGINWAPNAVFSFTPAKDW